MTRDNFKVVAIAGKLNSGKGVVGDAFTDLGFARRSFADPIKMTIHEMFDIPKEQLWGPSENRTGEIRQMLQHLGTEFGRHFRPDVWVDKMRKEIMVCRSKDYPGIVIPDLRFVNEAKMLREHKGIIVNVFRPDSGDHEVESAVTHRSETEIDEIPSEWITTWIQNGGTLEELQGTIAHVIAGIFK
jgi:hypothetical protein